MGLSKNIRYQSLRPGHEPALCRFLSDLGKAGDEEFFHPHDGDIATLRGLAEHPGHDLYVLATDGGEVLAYGLLRGWNEGYEIPSLGIAVHPDARDAGIGRSMMDYLEAMARDRGAPAIRLRVHKQNTRAIAIYERLGYALSPDAGDQNLLVGTKRFSGPE